MRKRKTLLGLGIACACMMIPAVCVCAKENDTTLVYGSGDYTRINPAMDEHGEINILLFDGLTAHDGDNQVVPGLASSWDFDTQTNTYTFHMAENATWHDGEPVTAEDVKFTIEAIMNPENGSENAPNYEDVQEINVIDDHTISFQLDAPNVAFLDYMTMAVLPKHLLEGEDMQTSDFFRNPVGTGPYKLESWEKGYDPRHPYTWGLLRSLPAFSRGKSQLYTIPGMPPTLIDPPDGDAYACRNEYALGIDYEKMPPMFPITDTHSAATWLLDKRAPKIIPPVGGKPIE